MGSISRRAMTQGVLGSLAALAVQRNLAAAPRQSTTLFDPLRFGDVDVSNRVLMAPLTRGRAGASRTPNGLMAQYYEQRASAGLIVSEGTAISPIGYGWVGSPGIYTPAQIEAWKNITTAVHRGGGRIFLQLWHVGRASHPDFHNGETPVGPSAIAIDDTIYTPLGKKPYVTPRALTEAEIAATVRDYAQATVNARAAGFDGVEIHGANGYLIDQFIRDGSNRREDRYGGSLDNRLRLLLEVTDAVCKAWSPRRTGVRLSPVNPYNDMRDSAPSTTFTEAARALDDFGLAYLHVSENIPSPSTTATTQRIAPSMRAAFKGPFILNGGYDASSGAAALLAGEADAIAYGRLFLANSDLVERFRRGASMNTPNVRTFYTDGAQGYTDYPTLSG
jgi:N-ethylmaleimide reductase